MTVLILTISRCNQCINLIVFKTVQLSFELLAIIRFGFRHNSMLYKDCTCPNCKFRYLVSQRWQMLYLRPLPSFDKGWGRLRWGMQVVQVKTEQKLHIIGGFFFALYSS